MGKKLVLVLLFIMACNISFANTPGNFGLGLILGEPTGLSVKVWQSDYVAYDAALAWSFGEKENVHIHIDYLLHNYKIIRTENSYTPIYYGIGGRIQTKDETALGVRIPVGINFRSRRIPIDIFLEIVPTLNIIPKTDFDLEGGIGARYYF
jgi:uncharacterized protein DUF3996